MSVPGLAYAGGYTTADRGGTGPGISVFSTTGHTGDRWVPVQTVDAGDNPSFLRFGPGAATLYAAHGGRTTVSAWRVAPDGTLSFTGREECGGVNPVDLAVWPGREALLVANYSSGTIAVLPLGPDGALRPAACTVNLARAGQPGPSMPHGVAFDHTGRFAFVPDKGLDCVHVFTLGPDLALVPAGSAACEPGAGPRHCGVHPTLKLVYVVNELGCSVQVFRWSDGVLAPLQTVPNLPPGAAGVAAEIAVAPDGRSVYASNRGHDTIAHFAADPETGLLGPARCTPCGGAEPRFFTLAPDGRDLLVCCQNSHRIVAFPLGPDGQPGEGAVVAELGSPTALCFRD